MSQRRRVVVITRHEGVKPVVWPGVGGEASDPIGRVYGLLLSCLAQGSGFVGLYAPPGRRTGMHSRRTALTGLVVSCLAFAAVPAAAQPVQEHGYVVGMGGATVGGVDAPMIGASVGVNVTPNLLITG